MIRRARLSGLDVLFVVGGGVLALVLFPLIAISVSTLQTMADKAWPPAVMSIHSSEFIDPSTLKMRFDVTRKKPCRFLSMSGFSGSTYDDMQPALSLHKADNSLPQDYPVGITVTSPPWLMYPVFGPRIMLYGRYDCDSRSVTSLVIDEVIAP